jgi:cytochrome c-type biogenesis protein
MEGMTGLLVTLVAGMVSFASPCVFPLIPSFLSFISGTSLKELKEGSVRRNRIVLRTLFFIGGFSTVFVLLGILISSSFVLLGGINRTIQRISGGIVILLGISVLYDRIPFLNREWRIHPTEKPTNLLGSFLVGMAFGAGWSPCIGPMLGGILLMASQEGELLKASLLLLIYSIGLGLPFLISSFFLKPLLERMKQFQRYLPYLRIASGLLLVGIGLSIFFGRFQNLSQWIPALGISLARFAKSNPSFSFYLPLFLLPLTGILPTGILLLRKRPPFPLWNRVLLATTFGLTLAQGLGWIDLLELLSRWLLFQGW